MVDSRETSNSHKSDMHYNVLSTGWNSHEPIVKVHEITYITSTVFTT